jgi:hypothetical protein
MKKLLMISGVILIALMAFSFKDKDKKTKEPVSFTLAVKNDQGETYMDVYEKIQKIIGKEVYKVTPELKSMIQECSDLYDQEVKDMQSKHGPYASLMMPKFCWVCYCSCCGCMTTLGPCKSLWGACPPICPCNGHGGGCWYLSVFDCAGSPCNSFPGK